LNVAELLRRIGALDSEAQRVLGTHEAAPARTMSLEDSYNRLAGLSVDQDELFRESLRAVEAGLYRAAHVLAWAGFIDLLHHHVGTDGLNAIKMARPNWVIRTVEDLREYADHQVIEAAREAKFYNKTVMKALHGLLNKRNECAHPSEYYPDFNETLGYVSELFQRTGYLKKKVGA
jgi:hypothetical protein